MKKILFVNPWIYDFAVYDFGIKPLGLLRIAEYLRRQGKDVHLIDCLEGCQRSVNKYGFSKIRKEKIEKPEIIKKIERPYFKYGISVPEFITKLETLDNVEKVYISSGMTYWYPGVFLAIKIIKKIHKKAEVILGGLYATLCHNHASRNSEADIVWKGHFLKKSYFNEKNFFPAYDLLKNRSILPVELTRGCPYQCSYCASRILNPRFNMKDPVSLFEEVMYYYSTFGTKSFVFYDDALTYNSQKGIKKFLRLIDAAKCNFRFHTPNGLHAKFIDDELAHLMKKTNFKDLRLSLETTDENIQEFTGGKVHNNDIKKALRNLKEAGFEKSDLGVYLLVGAPWLNIEKTKIDIKFLNSLGAKAILASYSPIPGTHDYEILVKNGIIKSNLDPLWHNKTIFSELLTVSYIEKVRVLRRFASKLNKE